MKKNMPISAAESLMRGGIAVFPSLTMLENFVTPYTLTGTLLVITIKGEISGTVDLQHVNVPQGSILVLRPGHVVKNIVETPDFDGLFIILKEEKFTELIPIASSGIVSCMLFYAGNFMCTGVSDKEMANLNLIWNLLLNKSQDLELPYGQEGFNALLEVLCYETLGIFTYRMQQEDSNKSEQRRRREDIPARFMQLVEEHFRQEHSVKFYADELNLSAKHLSSVVKSATGMPASEWIAKKIIREAQYLLRSTPQTIQQISTTLTFPNQSFFGKFFKSKVGITPREYRATKPQSSYANE